MARPSLLQETKVIGIKFIESDVNSLIDHPFLLYLNGTNNTLVIINIRFVEHLLPT